MNETQENTRRVLFFIESLNGGGAQRVLANLTHALVQRGYRVLVATNTALGSSYTLPSEVVILNYREGCSVGFVSKFHVYRKSKTISNIRRIAKNNRPDIIVSFMVSMNVDVLMSVIGLGIPVVCSEHTTMQRKLSTYASFGRSIVYKFANAVTVLTRSDYRVWKHRIKNLVYMPNPSNPEPYLQMHCERESIVLAAGRIDDWRVKGLDNLLKAWGTICHDFPEWRLCIAGGGTQFSFDELYHIANETKCKNVEFLGYRSDLNQVMASSSVFCLSSRNEGLPMVLIEAMGLGCCCVAFDCVTGPSEIITNRVSGILVKNQDVNELANALREVMKDEELRNQLSQNAPHAVQKYSSERVLKRWLILFDKILNN